MHGGIGKVIKPVGLSNSTGFSFYSINKRGYENGQTDISNAIFDACL